MKWQWVWSLSQPVSVNTLKLNRKNIPDNKYDLSTLFVTHRHPKSQPGISHVLRGHILPAQSYGQLEHKPLAHKKSKTQGKGNIGYCRGRF